MKKVLLTLICFSLIFAASILLFGFSNQNNKNENTTVENETKEVSVEHKDTREDYISELEALKTKYGIDGTYRESIDKDNNGYTSYCYEKVDRNGVVNPYDSLNVTVDNKTGKVFTEKRFDNAAFIEAKIDEKTAKDKAVSTHSDSTVEKCALEYYIPDYPKGDIVLAYRVQFKDGNIIYINAVSGDTAGKDQNK